VHREPSEELLASTTTTLELVVFLPEGSHKLCDVSRSTGVLKTCCRYAKVAVALVLKHQWLSTGAMETSGGVAHPQLR
jgi:hypothetical protein